ncbi:family 1 glycosylhydrolase [Nocardia sp. NBC_01503]|uniref:family 1 glycosylhydrolase n=1 Tax=Nocardia sp. NBC_01503 TaxID=2975997 RepID=UPI002E7AC9E8|nr:family 1 glycosylhydrolase [Nocardia sp. NBC_01503]WTL31495.1 family 1 glycosylhydrolase [Nocardia sp. NBC_01503]
MRRRTALAAAAAGLALMAMPPAAASPDPVIAPRVAPLPADFLWGVSSSGFQIEGDSPDSNWTRLGATGQLTDQVGTSADFLHRYREDIANAKALGVRVFRLSVEWARLEPQPGQYDPAAWGFYDSVLDAIHAAGMRPMITLDHWVYPGWAFDRGGWNSTEMSGAWIANARKVVDRYSGLNPLWITFNEPSAYVFQEVRTGGISAANIPTALDQWVRLHRDIYDYIHAVQPGAQVSSNIAYFPAAEAAVDTTFFDRVVDKLDFIGLDYYYSMSPTDLSYSNTFSEPWKSSIAADGIYYALRHYAKAFPDLPLYVVENGMPTENGALRPDGYDRADHLRDIVYWVQRAVADGAKVIGYNYWSITDNYEWGTYTSRFGLYTVDVKNDPTLTRRPTTAVDAYRALTANGGVPGDYRPSRPSTTCSVVDGLDSCLDPAG